MIFLFFIFFNVVVVVAVAVVVVVVVVVHGRPCHAFLVTSLPQYHSLSPSIPGAGLATVFNVRVQIAGLTDRRYSGDSSPMRGLLREVACQRPAVSSCR